MEWIDSLNKAIDYIEEHLTDKIDYAELGRIACCSSYHFQRMFTYMAGVSLSEYIRRRKMSLAAVICTAVKKLLMLRASTDIIHLQLSTEHFKVFTALRRPR